MKKILLSLLLISIFILNLTACNNIAKNSIDDESIDEQISTDENNNVKNDTDEYNDWKKAATKTTETKEYTIASTTEETIVDPYENYDVAYWHDVTFSKGIDYNSAIDEIIRGTSAYANTFPMVDNVDFNTPGVYNCVWAKRLDNGTYLPLDYATFTVTITDE